jgi:hypothetical protein
MNTVFQNSKTVTAEMVRGDTRQLSKVKLDPLHANALFVDDTNSMRPAYRDRDSRMNKFTPG